MNEIVLKAVEPEDVDFMLECDNEPKAARWSDYRAPLSRNQLLSYALTYDADPFAAGQLRLIAHNNDGQRVAVVDLYDISEKDSRAFIGIAVHPSCRDKGFGTLTLEAISDFCRDRLGIKSLAAKVSTENSVATSLFLKAGYEKIAVLPSWHKIGDAFKDFYLFRLQL